MKKCLSLLGVEDLFEEPAFGCIFLQPVCKPERAAFKKVFDAIGIDIDNEEEMKEVCFFEDSFKNLSMAKDLGMKTVFVQCDTQKSEGRSDDELAVFDCVLRNLGEDLRDKMPELWDANK